MEESLLKFLNNPAIPVWIVCLAVLAFVLEFLARGKTGEAVREWLKDRSLRSQSREDALLAILREMIEEQGRESDELEALLRQTREDLLGALDEAGQEDAARLDGLKERLTTLEHKAAEQRSLISGLNVTVAHLVDRVRDGLGEAAIRRAEVRERLDSLGAYLAGAGSVKPKG